MRKITIVAFNINRNNFFYSGYEALSAHEKINLLYEQIEKVCKILLKDKPKDQWIVAWREYGIFEPQSKFVSLDLEKMLLTKMTGLTKKYPNLTIISGTLAIKKNLILSHEHKAVILKEYQQASRIKMLEENIKLAKGKKNLHPETYQVAKHIQKIHEISLSSEVTVIKNTAYVFHGSKVYTHGKTAPYQETKDLQPTDNFIYSPGKSSPRMILNELTIGIEICREHDFQVLRYSPGPIPVIHFVISDGVNLNLANIEGKYVIQLDSVVNPCLILNDNKLYENAEASLVQLNALDKNATLSDPKEPFIPFEKLIVSKLDNIIKQFLDKNDPKYKVLITMREDFIENSNSIICEAMYKSLEDNINKNKTLLSKIDGKNLINGFAEYFFYKPLKKPNTLHFISELTALLADERAKNYVHKDFVSLGQSKKDLNQSKNFRNLKLN